MLAPAVTFYSFAVAVHVMCVVIAFGVIFAYPILIPWFRAHHPEAMPALHTAQHRVGRLLITPFMVLVLLTGVYLATDAHVWDQAWVTVPFVISIVLFGMGGAFFSPRERRLAELARHDLRDGGTFGEQYNRVFVQVARGGALASALILIAVFFMVAKPFLD